MVVKLFDSKPWALWRLMNAACCDVLILQGDYGAIRNFPWRLAGRDIFACCAISLLKSDG
jgi:hypothetical protein